MEEGQGLGKGRKALLVCGILSTLVYIALNVLGAMQYEGYSSMSQTISELSAYGAPSRPLWLPLGIAYDLLVMAFGFGVLASAGGRRRLRVAGRLLIVMGSLGFLWPFVSMHRREVLAAGGGTSSDVLHLVLGMVTLLVILALFAIGSGAFGKRFRLFSIGSIVVFIASGVLTGLDGPKIGANLPTPLIGVWERINLATFLLWAVVSAIILLREGKNSGRAMRIVKAENGMNIVGQGLRIILFTVPAIAGAIAAHVYMPDLVRIPLPGSVLKPIGFVLILCGAVLWLTAIVQLLTGFPKGKLVTAGAYRVCRNPIYGSFAFFILPGISLAAGTWVYFFVSAVLYLGVMVFIENEEKDLLQVFGEEYRRYTARVHRLIPFASGRAI